MTHAFRDHIIVACLLAVTAAGCNSVHRQPPPAGRVHFAERKRPGSLLYLDKVSNSVVMKTETRSGGTFFCSYLVGLQDSMVMDQARQVASQRYFEYDMSRDLKLLVRGDSIAPVFFQPIPKLNNLVKEGIVVFELPKNSLADTLVYRDSFGDWGTQLVMLNTK